jgi:hypothetical protein
MNVARWHLGGVVWVATCAVGLAGGVACSTEERGSESGPCMESSTELASVNAQSELGISAADVLRHANGTHTTNLRWNGDDAGASVELELEVTPNGEYAYVQSTVTDRFGADVVYDCPSRVEVDVDVRIRSKDGLLREIFGGVLTSTERGEATFESGLRADEARGGLMISVANGEAATLNLAAQFRECSTTGSLSVVVERTAPATGDRSERVETLGVFAQSGCKGGAPTPTSQDAGESALDAGARVLDAGATPSDSGIPSLESGPDDSGTETLPTQSGLDDGTLDDENVTTGDAGSVAPSSDGGAPSSLSELLRTVWTLGTEQTGSCTRERYWWFHAPPRFEHITVETNCAENGRVQLTEAREYTLEGRMLTWSTELGRERFVVAHGSIDGERVLHTRAYEPQSETRFATSHLFETSSKEGAVETRVEITTALTFDQPVPLEGEGECLVTAEYQRKAYALFDEAGDELPEAAREQALDGTSGPIPCTVGAGAHGQEIRVEASFFGDALPTDVADLLGQRMWIDPREPDFLFMEHWLFHYAVLPQEL